MSDWESGSGGEWQNWSVSNGNFISAPGDNPQCSTLSILDADVFEAKIFPNPFLDTFSISTLAQIKDIKLFSILGDEININLNIINNIETSTLSPGMYFLKLKTETSEQVFKLLKK